MSKFLKQFTDHADYEEYIEGSPIYPNVSECLNPSDVHYNNPKPIFYDKLIGDGVAYINTGHKLITIKDKVIVEGGTISGRSQYVAMCGVRWIGDYKTGAQMFIQNYQNDINPVVLTSSEKAYVSTFTHTSNVVFLVDFYHNIYTLNGANFKHGTSTSTGTAIAYSLYLFGFNDQGTLKSNFSDITIRRCEIYREDVQVLNLRPCTYLDEPGMWDTVSNTFFGNANTSGTFIVAND